MQPPEAPRVQEQAGRCTGYPPVPASPSCLAAALQSSQQLLPAVDVAGSFPRAAGSGRPGKGRAGSPLTLPGR